VSDVLVEGTADGEVLALDEPLSFWGGVHESSGIVIDTHHPQRGACVSGRILVMPSGRGSSSSSSVLAELIRAGVAPAAIVLGERDPIIALGALVAEALYGRTVPVVVLPPDEYARVAGMGRARLRAAGGEVDVWADGRTGAQADLRPSHPRRA
jgi:predicted aconitase with swiveling domain